jgi:hypothetical protein
VAVSLTSSNSHQTISQQPIRNCQNYEPPFLLAQPENVFSGPGPRILRLCFFCHSFLLPHSSETPSQFSNTNAAKRSLS